MTPEYTGTLTAGVPIQTIDTGNTWEYVRIINSSPYQLQVKMGGAGSFIHPEMFIEDIYTGPGSGYGGRIDITPIAVMSNVAQAPSFNLAVNAYGPGELRAPISQPITILTNQGNQFVTIATQVVNSGNAPGTAEVLGTPLNQSTQLELNNDGSGFLAGGRIVYTAANIPEQFNVNTTSFDQVLQDYHSARVSSQDWQLIYVASPTPTLEWLVVGSPNVVPLKLTNLGQTLDNGATFTDGFGRWSAVSYLLSSGNQETGAGGGNFWAGNASGYGPMMNFKTTMTNTPTSITFSSSFTSNANTPTAPLILKSGFNMQWTAPSSPAETQWQGTYTTMGN